MAAAGRGRGPAAFLLVFLAGCGSAAPPGRLAPRYTAWSEGPARWLLLPSEARRFRRLRDDAAAEAFIAEFWRRRDPDPATPDNPAPRAFDERVEAADRLYVEEEVRGALTDRGGAIILLGSPTMVRTSYRRSPAWGPAAPGGGHATRPILVETWVYAPEDLPRPLRDLARRRGRTGEASLTFVREGRRTRLLEGRDLLELAAEAAVQKP